jgi:hypothetical protein
MLLSVELSVEYLAWETEVLGENLPKCSSVHHKSHIAQNGLEPVRCGGELEYLHLILRVVGGDKRQIRCRGV